MKIPALLALLPLAALAVLVLAWTDVLPGAWTLRGWLEPHGARRLRELVLQVDRHLDAWAAESASAPPGTVVFLGSSTIARWPLAEAFPGATCLDRGIGDEPAWSLARRLPESLPAAPPAGCVVYTASVDLRYEGQSPETVATRVSAVLDALAAAAPGVPVLVVGPLPERDATPAAVARLAEASESVARVVRSRGQTFVPANRPPLARPDGALSEELSVDRLHLAPEGYAVLTEWVLAADGPVARLLAP